MIGVFEGSPACRVQPQDKSWRSSQQTDGGELQETTAEQQRQKTTSNDKSWLRQPRYPALCAHRAKPRLRFSRTPPMCAACASPSSVPVHRIMWIVYHSEAGALSVVATKSKSFCPFLVIFRPPSSNFTITPAFARLIRIDRIIPPDAFWNFSFRVPLFLRPPYTLRNAPTPVPLRR